MIHTQSQMTHTKVHYRCLRNWKSVGKLTFGKITIIVIFSLRLSDCSRIDHLKIRKIVPVKTYIMVSDSRNWSFSRLFLSESFIIYKAPVYSVYNSLIVHSVQIKGRQRVIYKGVIMQILARVSDFLCERKIKYRREI